MSSTLLESVCNYSLWRRGALQGHHNVHTRFVTIGHKVKKKNVNTADRHTRTREQYGDVKSLYCLMLSISERQSLSCSYYRSVCVCPLASYAEPAERLSRYMS